MSKVVIQNARSKVGVPNVIPCENIIKCGEFAYRVNYNWFQMPKGLEKQGFSGIACDKDDYVYCAVRHPKYSILVFAPDGKFVHFLAEGMEVEIAHGISVNSEGNIWLADDSLNVIRLIDKNTGEVLMTLGEKGKGSDTGIDPSWKGDSNAHLSIKRIAESFNRPTRLIEGQDGKLYVSDGYWNCAVHRFSHEGIYEKSWGGHGKEFGHFGILHSVWQDKRGRIWIADRNQDRIQAFDIEGNFLTCIDKLMMPGDVWSDDNYLYVPELDRRLSIFDMDCNMVAQIGYIGSLFNGHHIGGDSKGNLYLGYKGSGSVAVRLERIR